MFYNVFLLLSAQVFYCTRCIEKYTGKSIHTIICILIHSSFCILNFIFPACGPNFAEAVGIVQKVEQAWFNASPYARDQQIIFCAEQYLTTITTSLFPKPSFKQATSFTQLVDWEKFQPESTGNWKYASILNWALD